MPKTFQKKRICRLFFAKLTQCVQNSVAANVVLDPEVWSMAEIFHKYINFRVFYLPHWRIF